MKNKSFTLIELLVVIVIIGVIAGVIMVTVSSSVSNATFARAKAFSSNVQNSMLLNSVSEWTFDEGGGRYWKFSVIYRS
ncbi:MAG: prepilin-type N-terminal cleavage/methylation domain-containing protein [Candidatus Pacebacteria bacterium]|nr:prepilin-type N-terminal cleavage/methylation domain-containing protein [Candidatus Paceibacterota bacterium]